MSPHAADFDWCAVDDDTYDGAEDSGPRAHCIGRGSSEMAAIVDLLTQLEEYDPEAEALLRALEKSGLAPAQVA